MKCGKPYCRDEAEVIVDDQPLCDEHWEEHCEKTDQEVRP